MLFYLSNELLTDQLTVEKEEKVLRAIENILRSVWESKHLVRIDYNLIDVLLEKITNNDCRSVLLLIKNTYSFLSYDPIKYYVKVVDEGIIMNIDNLNGFRILSLSVDFLQTTDLIQESRVLCEDVSDASFFQKISEHYIKENSIGNISLKFEPIHGGGGLICVQFQNHIDSKNKFCLAFCDNDIRYPGSEIGSTLNDLQSINKNGNHLCEYIDIDAHEIENLVPFNYIDSIQQNYHNIQGIIFLKKVLDSDKREDLKYLDLKKGICKSKVVDNNDYLNFALSLQEFCDTPIEAHLITGLPADKQIVPNVGKIMKPLLDNSELFSTVTPELLEYQKEQWNRIGSNFFYWTCSRNFEPINI